MFLQLALEGDLEASLLLRNIQLSLCRWIFHFWSVSNENQLEGGMIFPSCIPHQPVFCLFIFRNIVKNIKNKTWSGGTPNTVKR
jgi:hypothetical protein